VLAASALAAVLGSCQDTDAGGREGECDDPIVAHEVDESRGCVDIGGEAEVVIGCLEEGDVVLPTNTCYRSSETGRLVFSHSIYPDVYSEWEHESGCGYSYGDVCE
jgi:hypothetical protein